MLNPLNFLSKFIKSSNQQELDRVNKIVDKVNSFEETIKNISDEDVANLPTSAIKSLALDKNNVLWIGTYRGLRVLYNTSNFFSEDMVRTESIIILEEGLPKELLAQQFITDIKVDGSNNKWISTADAGVFYLSSSGQKTIYHFTKYNSPLPSNAVNDMALDSDNGVVYFGTNRGLVAFKTGGSSTSSSLKDVYIYPNPRSNCKTGGVYYKIFKLLWVYI